MHPILFRIGDFPISTYGVAYSTSLLIASILAFRMAVRDGIKEERYLSALLCALVGIFVMSKLFHIAINFGWYMDHPKRFLNFRVGHIFYGGYIGALLFPWIYTRIVKEPFLPILDASATYMPLGLAIHRSFGCMSAGCCHGKPTDLPWGITFPEGAPASHLYGHVPVHPTQLYEAGFALIMFAMLLYWRKHYRKVPGEIITLQIFLYAIGRFMIEFLRGDIKRGFYGPLSTSQWVSLGMLVLVGVLVFYIRKTRQQATKVSTP